MGKTRRDRDVAAARPPRARTGAPRLHERFSRRDLSHAQLHSEVAEWKLLDLTRADLERYALEAAVEEEVAAAVDQKMTFSDLVAVAEAVHAVYYYGVDGGPAEEGAPTAEEVVPHHDYGGGGGPAEEEEGPAAEEAVPDHDYGDEDEDPAKEVAIAVDEHGGGPFEESPAEDEDHGGGEEVPAAAAAAAEVPAENDHGVDDPVPDTEDDNDDEEGAAGSGGNP